MSFVAASSQVMDAFDFRKFLGAHDDVAMPLLTVCESPVTALLAAKCKQAKLADFWK